MAIIEKPHHVCTCFLSIISEAYIELLQSWNKRNNNIKSGNPQSMLNYIHKHFKYMFVLVDKSLVLLEAHLENSWDEIRSQAGCQSIR